MSQQDQYSGNQTRVDLSAAPLADISFDDLFPPEGLVASPPQAQSEQPPQPEPRAQPVETPDEPFLKAPTGTVYKTAEEAIRGISEKDTTIERLRSQLQEATGVDPLTGKPVGTRPAAPQATQPSVPNFAQDPEAYWNATAEAVEKKDPRAWAAANQKFLQDNLAPVVPLLQNVARANALEQVSGELPGFREIRNSPEFNQMLDSMPLLKGAIQQSENDLGASQQLPELYRYAYLAYQGTKAQEIVRHGVPQTPAPVQPSRPTISPSSMTPPEPGPALDLATSEGRKAIIERAQRAGGVATSNWRDRGF